MNIHELTRGIGTTDFSKDRLRCGEVRWGNSRDFIKLTRKTKKGSQQWFKLSSEAGSSGRMHDRYRNLWIFFFWRKRLKWRDLAFL